MSKSRLSTIVIDCPENKFEDAVAFWSAALGLPVEKNQTARYVSLEGRCNNIEILLQKVPGEAAIHLDLESDGLSGEAARLKQLGAAEKYPVKTWLVMEAPGGHAFCIVPRQAP